MRLASLATACLLLLAAGSAIAAPRRPLPFSADEDRDGARSVWFLLNVSGADGTRHAYEPAKAIPSSRRWLQLAPDEPLQPLDMAWWPEAVALVRNPATGTCIFKNTTVPLEELRRRFGAPVFRRFDTAEKPLALILHRAGGQPPVRVPAVLPGTAAYGTIFDLAINSRGTPCSHDPDKVWVSIADTDAQRVYDIDHAGCITGENRTVAPAFHGLIEKLQHNGTVE